MDSTQLSCLLHDIESDSPFVFVTNAGTPDASVDLSGIYWRLTETLRALVEGEKTARKETTMNELYRIFFNRGDHWSTWADGYAHTKNEVAVATAELLGMYGEEVEIRLEIVNLVSMDDLRHDSQGRADIRAA